MTSLTPAAFWALAEDLTLSEPETTPDALALLRAARTDWIASEQETLRLVGLVDTHKLDSALLDVHRLVRLRAAMRAGDGEALDQAVSWLTQSPPAAPSTHGRLAHIIAAIALRRDQIALVENALLEAVEQLEPGTARVRMADTAAALYCRVGAWREARNTWSEVIRHKQLLGDRPGCASSRISLARMELGLGRAASAAEQMEQLGGLDAVEFSELPATTRIRALTLHAEALVAGPAPSCEELVQARARLVEALACKEVSVDLQAFGWIALARVDSALAAQQGAVSDSAPACFDRAISSSYDAYVHAYLGYHRHLLGMDDLDDERWLTAMSSCFDRLRGLTEPEVLTWLLIARKSARSGDIKRAEEILQGLESKVRSSNHPLWARWLDEAWEETSPVQARQRLLRRFLGDDNATLDAARRVNASIVFSDLVGFTKRSNDLTPEEVMETSRTLFELSADLLERHQLVPLAYLGDGLFAMATGDTSHPSRAFDCACALVRRMRLVSRVRAVLNEDDKVRSRRASARSMAVRCGVATGDVVLGVLGSIARMEFSAIGMTTNRAARLQSVAGEEQVVCDERILGGREVQAEALSLELKGIDGLVQASRVSPAERGFSAPRPAHA